MIRSACCRINQCHPLIAGMLKGSKMVRYGARHSLMADGTFHSTLASNGWMIVGDSAGFGELAAQRYSLAIKTRMAAEATFAALLENNFSAARAQQYPESVESSWIKG